MISKPLFYKELEDIFREKTMLSVMTLPLLIFCIILPLILVLSYDILSGELSNFLPIDSDDPIEMIKVLGITFISIVLLVPIMIANTFSSYSIVGEKENNTLESLYNTPLSSKVILNTKLSASVFISILISGLSFLLYVLTINIASYIKIGVWINFVVPLPIVVMGILLILASALLVMILGFKFKTAKGAQQIGTILIIPLGMSLFNMNNFLAHNKVVWIFCFIIFVLVELLYIMMHKKFSIEKVLTN